MTTNLHTTDNITTLRAFLTGLQETSIAAVLSELTGASGFSVRAIVQDRLQSEGPVEDFYTDFAVLIFAFAHGAPEAQGGSPRQVFEIAFKALQMAQQIGSYRLVAEALLPWLAERWAFIWERQRFLLNRPSLHGINIKEAMNNEEASTESMVVETLVAILPTLGIENQSELSRILATLPR